MFKYKHRERRLLQRVIGKMKLTAVSGIMLALLLIGMLTLAFNVQPVEAEPIILTVDDDGRADLHTIQEDINAATPEDTIYAHAGLYHDVNSSDNPEPEFVLGEIILEFTSNVSIGQSNSTVTTGIKSVDELNKRFEVTDMQRVVGTIFKLVLLEDADVISISTEYGADSNVEYAEPNYIYPAFVVPNDANYSQQWAHQNIQSELAWDIETGDPDVVIAVVDTGVDWNHPDLAANIWNNTDEIIDGADTDGNGYIDDVRGYDFVDTAASVYPGEDGKVRDNDPMDFHGHGTHCSGIAAAVTNNSIGVAGVSWNCKIMPVRAGYKDPAGYGSLEADDAALAIIYAADNGANIISMSWGGYGSSSLIKDAIDYAYAKGVVLVAAAGNYPINLKCYPAGYDNVIAVAATAADDSKASWSGYGSWVDVSAPGVNIYSTLFDDTYDSWSGTSMSTPFVAGLAGLILSKNSTFTNEEVRNILRSTTDPVISSEYIGLGRINAYEAIQRELILITNLNSSLDDVTVGEIINITGTANGTNFQRYTVEYGSDVYPVDWTLINESTLPVINGVLAIWDTSLVLDGSYTIKLTAVDVNNKTSEDRVVLNVDNVYITSPVEDEFYGENIINITGTATGTFFENYTVEYGFGTSPTTWHTEGITLMDNGTKRIANGTLAVWNTSVLNELDPHYTLRLIAYNIDASIIGDDYVTLHIDHTLQAGWPQSLPTIEFNGWMYSLTDSPTVADVDNDGDLEILVAYGEEIYVYNHDGTYLAGWPKKITTGGSMQISPAAADLDLDGSMEIIIGDSKGYLHVLNNNGMYLPGWPRRLFGSYIDTPVIEDVNEDGYPDIIVADWWLRGLHVIDYTGAYLAGWPRALSNLPTGAPSVGDIDNDGDIEILISDDYGVIYAFHHNGLPVGGWPIDINDTGNSYLALGDIDGDNYLEAVIGSSDHKVYAFNHDGSLVTGWPVATSYDVESSPALGDIDGDGDLEIVAGSRDRYLYAWHHDGSLVDGWPVTEPCLGNIFYGFGSPSIGDIDGDGQNEIVVDNDNPYLYAYNGDGSTVEGFPKHSSSWGAFCSNTPAIADLDGDGDVEVAYMNMNCDIFVWDLNGTYDPQRIEWGMFHHDERHTGLYVPPSHDVIVTLEAPDFLEPHDSSLLNATVRNRGFNNETNVKLQLLINGSIVDSVIIPELPSGSSYTVSYLWTPTIEGIYNVTAYALPVPDENVTINNVKSVIVLVKAIPNILIVNDDDGSASVSGTSLQEFESALTAAGYDYQVWNESSMGNPSLDFLTNFKLVIWTCGDYWYGAVDPTDAVTLESYVAQGGNILLEGEDIGYDHHADSFMVNVAHAIFQVDNTGALGLTVTAPTHPVTQGLPANFAWLTDPPYDDGVTPTNGGFEVIRYTDTSWTAVTVFDGTGTSNGSIVYYTFPMHCLAQSERDTLIINSVKWLLPRYTFTVHSVPSEVTFTVDGVPHTTPWSETYDDGTLVSLVMPSTHTVGDARYYWNQWSDGNTSRSRTVTMNTNITLTAHYTGPYYQLTVTSSPITGIPFTINGVPRTTPYTEWLPEGSYTLIMPETHNGYVWSHWLENGDTNRIKTILLQGTTWTAVYKPAPKPVGGKATPITIPMNKPETPTLWIWLSTFILSLALTVVYVKKRKRKTEINS